MNVIHSVARYFPEPCGGIQVHIDEMIPSLRTHGIESKVVASQDSAEEATYRYNGVDVYRYPVFPAPKNEPNHGELPHGGFQHFANWLKQQQAEIYHQHQWTPKCGLPHLRLAKQLGMATIVTIHLAQPICQRHSMMLNGQEACDGKIDPVRCSRCCEPRVKAFSDQTITALSQVPSALLSRMPIPPNACEATPVGSGVGRWMRPFVVPAFVAARRRSLLEMAEYADRIIVVSDWLRNTLLSNGVPSDKVVLCRCGISDTLQRQLPRLRYPSKPLRVGFLGRWHPAKGVHILVEAIQSLPAQVPIELVIHAVESDTAYQQDILQRIAGDRRIQVAPCLSREELPQALAEFDVVAVPSQCLETGPLVALEAHANGVPVLGSDLGGIAELVTPGVDGLLVPPQDVRSWAAALKLLAHDTDLLTRLRQGIGSVRTLSLETAELAALYRQLLGQTHDRLTNAFPR